VSSRENLLQRIQFSLLSGKIHIFSDLRLRQKAFGLDSRGFSRLRANEINFHESGIHPRATRANQFAAGVSLFPAL
jgi:hypothetical protein